MISETLFSKEGVSANSKQLAQLQALFPNCFDKNGKFLLKKFQMEIAEQTDISREFYEMNWLGKSYAKLLRNLPPETLLCEDKTHNAKPENANSQNLLIQGDNLEVLKHLKNAYEGSVKMIYIDPPYNTGSDGFVYQDDRKFTPEQLSELAHISLDEAERILKFTAKGSNSHSAWLTFIYPRLYIARDLLKEDGIIFISIDDNEVAQLKLLCDEVFGEGNFISSIAWEKKFSPQNDAKFFSNNHEYILCYAKLADRCEIKLLPRTEEANSRYRNLDNDPRGVWTSDNLLRKDRQESGIYTIITPNGTKHNPPSARSWRVSKAKFDEMLADNRIWFGESGGNVPRIKRFLSEVQNGIKVISIWKHDEVGHNQEASQELRKLFEGETYFDTPKPIRLLKKILMLSTDENDLVMDFFAGSASTAHAVMQLNAEDGGNRQFILVQLPEKTDEKSEAFKAGYKTIFDITKARIEKSAVKIRQGFPDTQCDLGFKIYQTTNNFRQHSDEKFSLEQATLPFVENLTESQYHSLLTTWALNDGALLTAPISDVKLGNYTAHLCDKRLYLLQTGFTSEDLLAFIQKLDNDNNFNPNRVIVFGENIPSHLQQELNQAINTYNNKKNIALSLIIRN
ncbi:site-specific DNA-methyltransferase [Rodentibacter ratti]|nr:site-specific DNA-methyltransferase [Rodentibacter ratti]